MVEIPPPISSPTMRASITSSVMPTLACPSDEHALLKNGHKAAYPAALREARTVQKRLFTC